MNRQNWRAFVFLLLGVALLANPLYLYPDGVSYETTYTYEASTVEYLPHTTHTDYSSVCKSVHTQSNAVVRLDV